MAEVQPKDPLEQAVELHQAGDLDQAQKLYQSVLARRPANAVALRLLGTLLFQRDEFLPAERLLLRSVAVNPNEHATYLNLGNLYNTCSLFAEGDRCYCRALELDPDNVDVLNCLATIRRKQHAFDDAIALNEKALELEPDSVAAHHNLGMVYRTTAQLDRAIDHFRKAVAIFPGPDILYALAVSLSDSGQKSEAGTVLKQILEIEPENAVALHMLSTVGELDVPERASNAYVESVFDYFSSNFDERLETLDYQVPTIMGQAVAEVAQQLSRKLSVLDLGCGTGLCGEQARPYARQLIGVDLSEGMLARAQTTGVYEQLVQEELGVFLQDHHNLYDLILCGDTLNYFGVLDDILLLAAQHLESDGQFIFTLESADERFEEEYGLGSQGRYQHNKAYVARAMDNAGLATLNFDTVVLRTDGGKPVAGYLIRGCKSGLAAP